ncbi:hypothetical protein LTR37_009607 [Vermiconidia calcicola]|uniref:Uncharacterized protein n=1 Tax=Vermiconidia calcicola TaxID=1690605 RepID=A0ACC3NA21_9PEZI|nr:hypothetical protein LTR37_009607 [Vermiconidia calcicola]
MPFKRGEIGKKNTAQQQEQQHPELPEYRRTMEQIMKDFPNEILLRILWNLRTPNDKKTLQAVNGTCRRFHQVVQGELFRTMNLKYSYDYDLQQGVWMVPKLVRLVDEQPQLAVYMKAIELVIVPVLERVETTSAFLNTCDSNEAEGQDTDKHYDEHYGRWYGILPDTAQTADRWELADATTGRHRVLFGSYVRGSLGGFLSRSPCLEHLEAGCWSLPTEELARYYSLLFARTIMLEALPQNITSIRFHGPLEDNREQIFQGGPPTAFRRLLKLSTKHLENRIPSFAHQLTNLELDVCYLNSLPVSPPSATQHREPWKYAMEYWSHVLQLCQNLESLRLTNALNLITQKQEYWCLGAMLEDVRLPNVRRLYLCRWTLTQELVADRMSTSFPRLIGLGLDDMDLRSEDVDAWAIIRRIIIEKYGIIDLSVTRLRQQTRRGRGR